MNSRLMPALPRLLVPSLVVLAILAWAIVASAQTSPQTPSTAPSAAPLAAPPAGTAAPGLPQLESELQFGPPDPGTPAQAAPGAAGPGLNGPGVTGPVVTGPPAGPQAIPGNCLPCDYWIVSSRNCRQQDARSGSSCCLQFYHRISDRCLLPADRATFLGSLSPDRPVCFVIHGSYNRAGDVISESRLINQWIRSAAPQSPLQVVFFTWPSDGNLPFIFPVDIAILGRRSSYHALFLSQLITELPPTQPVSLLGHSHGARAAAATLHLLGGGCIEGGNRLTGGMNCPRRIRAALLAPAIDHNWLNPGDRYGMALCPPERVLIMRNSRDLWLTVYSVRSPFTERSLGRFGLDQSDRMTLNGLNAKVTELDVTPLVREGHAWSNYYQSRELAAGVMPYLDFQDQATIAAPAIQTMPTPGIPPANTTSTRSGPAPVPARAQPTWTQPASRPALKGTKQKPPQQAGSSRARKPAPPPRP